MENLNISNKLNEENLDSSGINFWDYEILEEDEINFSADNEDFNGNHSLFVQLDDPSRINNENSLLHFEEEEFSNALGLNNASLNPRKLEEWIMLDIDMD